jgi:hypothetical protein
MVNRGQDDVLRPRFASGAAVESGMFATSLLSVIIRRMASRNIEGFSTQPEIRVPEAASKSNPLAKSAVDLPWLDSPGCSGRLSIALSWYRDCEV